MLNHRLDTVSKEELAAMDADSGRCALELSDARVDCWVTPASSQSWPLDRGTAVSTKDRLERVTVSNGAPAPVVASAGRVDRRASPPRSEADRANRAVLKPLTEVVVAYIEASHRARLPSRLKSRTISLWASRTPGTRRARQAHRHQRRRCDRPVCMRADAVARSDTDRGGPCWSAGHQLPLWPLRGRCSRRSTWNPSCPTPARCCRALLQDRH